MVCDSKHLDDSYGNESYSLAPSTTRYCAKFPGHAEGCIGRPMLSAIICIAVFGLEVTYALPSLGARLDLKVKGTGWMIADDRFLHFAHKNKASLKHLQPLRGGSMPWGVPKAKPKQAPEQRDARKNQEKRQIQGGPIPGQNSNRTKLESTRPALTKAATKASIHIGGHGSGGTLRLLQASKCFVGLCGAMWSYGCAAGLYSVVRGFMTPGGIEWMQEQSSHGMLGVLLFVAFTAFLLSVQLYKIWNIFVATTLAEVRRSFLWLAMFNVFFVYMCSWRVSPGFQSLSWRDTLILGEAVCMVAVVFLYWLRQPWRGRGRKLEG